jgi:hypothetical protein
MFSITKHWLHVSALIAFIFFALVGFHPFINRFKTASLPPTVSNTESFQASKRNVWADLSKNEALDLKSYLFSKKELNLTKASEATRFETSPIS